MMLTIDKEFSPLEQCSVEGMDVHAARFASLLNNLRKKGFDLLNYRNMAFDEDFDKFLELVDDLKVSNLCINLKPPRKNREYPF